MTDTRTYIHYTHISGKFYCDAPWSGYYTHLKIYILRLPLRKRSWCIAAYLSNKYIKNKYYLTWYIIARIKLKVLANIRFQLTISNINIVLFFFTNLHTLVYCARYAYTYLLFYLFYIFIYFLYLLVFKLPFYFS